MFERVVKIAEIIIAVAAVVIAGVAYRVSVQQSELAAQQTALSREHNRLSVRPALDFISLHMSPTGHYKLSLENNGVGPAVVQDVSYFVDGAKIPTAHLALGKLFDFGPLRDIAVKYVNGSYSEITPGTFIAPNTSKTTMRFDLSEDITATTPQEQKNIRDLRASTSKRIESAKNRLCAYMSYCSVYKEMFVSNTGEASCKAIAYSPPQTCTGLSSPTPHP